MAASERGMLRSAVSPWFLAPFCFGAGAAFATLILGVPDLWNPVTAAWASAIATGCAATVALVVGVVPEIRRRRESHGRAFAQLHVTETQLGHQLLHVSRAIVLGRGGEQELLDKDAREGILKEIDQVDPSGVIALLSFSEVLSRDAFIATGRCAADMPRVRSAVRVLSSVEADEPLGPGEWLTGLLVDMYLSMDAARLAYAKELGRKPERIPYEPYEVTAARNAEAARAV